MEGLSEDVKEKIVANKLSLEDLPLLTDEDIKELAPALKDRLELRALIEKCKVCDSGNFVTVLDFSPSTPIGGISC